MKHNSLLIIANYREDLSELGGYQPEFRRCSQSPTPRRVADSIWAKFFQSLRGGDADACGAGAIGTMIGVSKGWALM